MLTATRLYIASFALTLIALFAVLQLGLLSALLSGLLVYNLVHLAAPVLGKLGVSNSLTKTLALALLAIIFILLIVAAVISGLGQLTNGSEGVVSLFKKMAEIMDTAQVHVPDWAKAYFPSNLDELESIAAKWLREHAGQLQLVGRDFGVLIVRIIVGMVIGGMIALSSVNISRTPGPLALALVERASVLSGAFRNIVFSQIRISALNTFLTAIYLVVILPILGVHLPLVKTMIVVTFVAGLLPVIGNLISNTIIVIVGLSVSFMAAFGSLAFLVVIHKLEYFLNARIIGARIKSRSWELLLAMVFMEAWFGVAGLIAAPIYYAYLKDELTARKLI
ncbi:AI-2E family transporter [Phyllobacterium sp. P30BS-XVII]|uniref:AI-2E family transporter n=1 Tax=Phyllobacterium sp. P30BS-XVII TaxID=2587046 RepID=UPI000DDB307D|nr:AI-2E family transporter [Phyllobacterium sp. P30BS-XVII]MBA8899202.1 putative PurR-regulated permease PerM [Phyllobacterium sp. P30BS-XVII]